MDPLQIKAVWDADAEVYVATSSDIPGLVAEAGTPEELLEKLRVLVPEMLELNAHLLGDRVAKQVDCSVETRRMDRVTVTA